MGAVVNAVQHEQDLRQLQALADLCPVYRRHLSHHLRNCLAGIVGSLELAQRNLDDRFLEVMRQDLGRALEACEHLRKDIDDAGL